MGHLSTLLNNVFRIKKNKCNSKVVENKESIINNVKDDFSFDQNRTHNMKDKNNENHKRFLSLLIKKANDQYCVIASPVVVQGTLLEDDIV